MKRSTLIFALFTILLALSVVPAHASVSVESTVNESIYAVYNFQNLNSTVYDEVKNNPQFNVSTIPMTIVRNLENQGRIQVNWGFGPQADLVFNDAARTVQVSFYLWGSDIISSGVNQTTMKRTCQVKTDWRKFQLSLTSSFSLNFTQILAKPVAEWQKTNEYTFLYEGQDISFKFILPQTATQVQAQEDTITFEAGSLSFWDIFLNSPFLILAVLIIVVIIALIYRKVR
jgi:hypothetical protein